MPQYDNNIDRTSIAPHVDAIVDSFVPDHIQASYPELIAFVRAYLAYLEESNLSGYYQNTLPQQRDIKTQDSQFLRRIEQEIGLFVPRRYEADPKIFYDRISELWRSKGSQEAIETFFRLFLDDPVQVRFPYEQVLIPSDGRWIQDDKIRVTSVAGDAREFAGKQISQVESFATATVSRVERRVYSDGIIWELTLAKGSIVGEFFERNNITTDEDLTLRAEIYRSVSSLTIVSGGSGYRVNDRIFLKGYEGITFVGYVNRVDENTGEILDTRIVNFGSGNTPNHIQETNTTEDYYLEDFLLYEYDSPNDQVGQSSLEFEVETLNGSGASFSLNYAPIVRTEGRYIGVKGQLSESIVLQDSYFYQKYSYEVITNFPLDLWQGPIKRTVSPAGTIVFGNVRVTDNLELGIDAQQFSFITIPAVYELSDSQSVGESLDVYSQDYNVLTDFYFLESYVGTEVTDTTFSVGTNADTNNFTTEQV